MKLRRALAILVLLGFAVVPMMADPAVVTGDVYMGTVWDLGKTSSVIATASQVTGTGVYGYTNLYVKANVSPFITTTYWLYFYVGNKNQDLVIGTTLPDTKWFQFPSIIAAYAVIDLTKPFGIDPATLDDTLLVGFYGAWDNGYSLMGFYNSYSDVSVAGAAGQGYDWTLSNTLNIAKDYYVKFAVAPRSLSTGPVTTNSVFTDMIVGAYATPNLGFGTVRAEVFYDTNFRTDLMGVFIADGRVEIPLGTDGTAVWVGGGFNYDLSPATATAITVLGSTTQQYKWMASGKVFVGANINAAVGVWGNNWDMLDGAEYTAYVNNLAVLVDGKGADGKVDANKVVSVDLCFEGKLSFESYSYRTAAAKTLIQHLDQAVRLNLGTADLYLGYLYTDVAGGAAWGANVSTAQTSTNFTALTNGGLYVRCYIPF